MKTAKQIAIGGDVLYILWVLYNGIDAGFKDIKSVEAVSLLSLIALLTFQIILLSRTQ